MTRLYECDNCGDHIKSARKKLYVKTGTVRGLTTSDNYTAAYHICEDCWEELGWDDD